MKRIIENIKWLFNHPPTNTRIGPAPPCDYCGETRNIYSYHDTVCICPTCRKKVYDSALLKPECKHERINTTIPDKPFCFECGEPIETDR